MFGFLGFLLIIFLLIVFIGFTILGNILRVLFGVGTKSPLSKSKHPPTRNKIHILRIKRDDENENFAESSSSNRRSHSSGNRKKIFDEDEGEYVDYEEVK